MKKINFIDIVAIVIVILNLLSFFLGIMSEKMIQTNDVLLEVAIINYFYIIFGIPFSAFFGTILNITSWVFKSKEKTSFKLNICLFIMLLLMVPVWQYFFWQALLSV